MSTPWFFLSYARTDTGAEDLKHFYSELVTEIRRKAGLPSNTPETDIGFMDTSGIQIGEKWPEKVGDALRTCRTLICLYSRGFFNSEYCGREFQVFSSRLSEYVSASQRKVARPNLIFPVLWDSPLRVIKHMPHAVTSIEYINDTVSKLYASEGLYHLSKVQKKENVDAYNEFVQRLSDRIVQEAESDLLPPLSALRPFTDEQNAFRLPAPAGVQGAAATRGGPNTAHFVYVAGRNSELGVIRQKIDCYGEEGYEWRPYHPEFEKPVWLISQSVATNEGLQYGRLGIDEEFIGKLRAAEEKNIIVVVVVDPWSIQMESYQSRMSEFDRRDFLNCGILIPWNERDEETSQSMNALQKGVQTTFERKFVLNPTYFRGSIRSLEELQREICDTINEVRARLIKRAEVKSPLTGGGGPMPLLINAPVK